MIIPQEYIVPEYNIARELFFNVGGPSGIMKWVVLLFFLISVFYCVASLLYRKKLWYSGKGEIRTNRKLKRFYLLIKAVFFQKKIRKEAFPGIIHLLIFYSVFVFCILYLILFFNDYIYNLLFGTTFIYGKFYLYYSLVSEIAICVLFFALLLALYRRYILRPESLKRSKADRFFLSMFFLIIFTGITENALRISLIGMPDYEKYSFLSYYFSYLFESLDQSLTVKLHYLTWWIHSLLIFSFIGLMAKNKFGHIVFSALNIYYQNLDNLYDNTKFRVNPVEEKKLLDNKNIGVATAKDFTWKHLLDNDACTSCGRCQDVCPAWLGAGKLSPAKLISDIKKNMKVSCDKEFVSYKENQELIENNILKDELWACTNCGACVDICPVGIEHVQKIIDIRRSEIIDKKNIPAGLKRSFDNILECGSFIGLKKEDRYKWIPEELEIKPLSENPFVEYLFYAGCTTVKNPETRKAALSFLKILKKAGYSVGILGEEENCCGDSLLRVGNEKLFREISVKNIKLLNNYRIKKIITFCPHGYNVFKKEYPLMANNYSDELLHTNYEVFHYTEILSEIIEEEKIILSKDISKTITYHDPCFLGKYNNKYKDSRKILRKIPGAMFIEMNNTREKSTCCGGGSGINLIKQSDCKMISELRSREAHSTGAQIVATSCPKCNSMLNNSFKELDLSNIVAMDLTNVIYGSIDNI